MAEYVGAIEKQTLDNSYFRQVLFTAQHSQLVVMCLRPGEDIGDEVHPKVDQFFRIRRMEPLQTIHGTKARTVTHSVHRSPINHKALRFSTSVQHAPGESRLVRRFCTKDFLFLDTVGMRVLTFNKRTHNLLG
jgi:hypothetical protein